MHVTEKQTEDKSPSTRLKIQHPQQKILKKSNLCVYIAICWSRSNAAVMQKFQTFLAKYSLNPAFSSPILLQYYVLCSRQLNTKITNWQS